MRPDAGAAEQLAARLIEAAGSKREAMRFIKAAKVNGNGGRKLSYREVDQRLIANAVSLESHWRRLGATPPKRLELIKRQVKACWLDKGTDLNGNPRGKWDESTCQLFLLSADLGTNPDAVMRRIRNRPELEFNEENSIAEYSFDSPEESGQASFWKGAQSTFAIALAPDSWTWLHRQRPEFDLLLDPGESRN
jgi:hypothetical protein